MFSLLHSNVHHILPCLSLSISSLFKLQKGKYHLLNLNLLTAVNYLSTWREKQLYKKLYWLLLSRWIILLMIILTRCICLLANGQHYKHNKSELVDLVHWLLSDPLNSLWFLWFYFCSTISFPVPSNGTGDFPSKAGWRTEEHYLADCSSITINDTELRLSGNHSLWMF
jgi:hypothetical protein